MRLFTGITSADLGGYRKLTNHLGLDKRIHMFSRSWTGPGPRRVSGAFLHMPHQLRSNTRVIQTHMP